MHNETMTPMQWSFLVVLLSVVAFAVGNMLIAMHNMERTSQAWGMTGGVLFLVSIPVGIAGIVLCVLSAVHDRRESSS